MSSSVGQYSKTSPLKMWKLEIACVLLLTSCALGYSVDQSTTLPWTDELVPTPEPEETLVDGDENYGFEGKLHSDDVHGDETLQLRLEEQELTEQDEFVVADESGERTEVDARATKICGCTYWTNWLDRDDSTGTGDWETLSAFVTPKKPICEAKRPLAIMCRARYLPNGRYTYFNQDTDFSTLPTPLKNIKMRVKCNPEWGLLCLNKDQKTAIGCRHFDFQVRFRCPHCNCLTCEQIWRDRDNPSGTGDHETREIHPAQVCEGNTPLSATCTVKSIWSGVGSLPQVFDQWTAASKAPDKLNVPCTSRKGLQCLRSQNKGTCRDYQIKYCCFSGQKYWTSWLDRDDPSGTGDWETARDFRKRPYYLCNGMTPLAAMCRVKGTTKTFNQWNYSSVTNEKLRVPCTPETGLACVNSDQRDRRCQDYEIRFLCPCN